jgi:ribosome biogenesis GTPase / thiamine phosphate phosphatase
VRPDLSALGWDERWARELSALGDTALLPARVIFAAHGLHRISDGVEAPAVLAGSYGRAREEEEGKTKGKGSEEQESPVTGDWVAFTPPSGDGPRVIRALLPRRGALARRSPGGRKSPGSPSGAQTLAANVDTVFIVNALDADFSPRRIERYLALAWEGGALPVVVLNKTDLCPDLPAALARAAEAAPGAEVVAACAASGSGVEELRRFLAPGRTVAFLGSSGVGKSTLVNRLQGVETQATGEVREEDGKGRHVTSSRELILLAGGGLLLDTPGLREVGLPGEDGTGEGLAAVFPEIVALAARCRYRDCSHSGEPGCAVEAGVAEGTVPAERLCSWRRLAEEAEYQRTRSDARTRGKRNPKKKLISRAVKGYFDLKKKL